MLKVGYLYTGRHRQLLREGRLQTNKTGSMGQASLSVYPIDSNGVEISLWQLLMYYEIKCNIFMDFTP